MSEPNQPATHSLHVRIASQPLPPMSTLVDQYADRLYRAAALGQSPDDARDLCQETFLIAARNPTAFEGRSTPYTWLYGIMKNLRRTHRRKAARPLPTDTPRLSVATPEAKLTRQQTHQRVHAAIARLPESQREAVALFYLEELSVADVAQRLGVPVGTVKSRLSAARSVLRRALKGDL